jgi:two-component system chemotaxis sensor kinase CheA
VAAPPRRHRYLRWPPPSRHPASRKLGRVARREGIEPIRVDVEKVDRLINLVGELVITQSMLTQAATMLDPVAYERFSAAGHLERNARDRRNRSCRSA